jgi:hypothetical protein
VNVSKKVIAQTLGNVVALVVGYVASRQGAHLPTANAAEIAGVASMIAGPVAGYLTREEPSADAVVGRVLATLASAGVSNRSVLSGVQVAAKAVSAEVNTVDAPKPVEPASVVEAAHAMPE